MNPFTFIGLVYLVLGFLMLVTKTMTYPQAVTLKSWWKSILLWPVELFHLVFGGKVFGENE